MKKPAEQLAPYHEFECTGINDQYVQDVDLTEELRENYFTEKVNRYVSSENELYDPYDDQFWRRFTDAEMDEYKNQNNGREPMGSSHWNGLYYACSYWNGGTEYFAKIHFLPEGYTEQKFNCCDVMTFSDFVQNEYSYKTLLEHEEPNFDDEGGHKFGYIVLNENGDVLNVIRRTNPNAKWDWYQIGGRWTGMFKLKPQRDGFVGKPGLMTESPEKGYVDQAYKRDIDFESIREEHRFKAGELYDKVMAVIGHLPVNETWESVLKRMEGNPIDMIRDEYHSQPRCIVLKACEDSDIRWIELDNFTVSREAYVERAGNAAAVTFALIKDGKWYERGEMGWFGCVTNEGDRNEWAKNFNELLDSLPGDTLLTAVDCHI